ncbi:phenylacetate--CoA ligase family protein [Aquimarina sp. 2201CG14-23]|uniref:phenylacetate--CoA ligase family protein n=1 Tax=Aquimarina mycalae TaxID=3040073 RepID=UPI0024782169|nr:AMP-binding protein [Aquimarina sp. 2201CG14-23]MDH7446725.1 AMP-binding protein [Aquimarina sp. 2201CG14-23]
MIQSIEQSTQTEISNLQNKKLQELIAFVFQHSPYYKRLFSKYDIALDDINTVEDLKKLPITTKDDLQAYNDDFLCVPKSEIVDYVTTSGTLGKPVTFALTENDLERLAYNEAISFETAGVTKNDVVQLTTTLDRRFMAGLAYFLGTRKLGAAMVRVGAGIPELQWDSIQRFQSTYLVVVPSFLLKLISYAETHGIDYKNSSVKAAICIGEPLRDQDFNLNTLGSKIKEKWDIELYSTYASTEMSTAFTECEAHQGGHHRPELIIAEILDENGALVQEGEVGELAITTLGLEAMPLLRYTTGDMVQSHKENCSCGRTTMRLSPVLGRKKHMIKYKGTTLYPQSVIEVLTSFEGLGMYVIEVVIGDLGTDKLLIHVSNSLTAIQQKELKEHLRANLRVVPDLVLNTKEALKAKKFPEMSRKPISFIDSRDTVSNS